jgi:hypothetical protein
VGGDKERYISALAERERKNEKVVHKQEVLHHKTGFVGAD